MDFDDEIARCVSLNRIASQPQQFSFVNATHKHREWLAIQLFA